MIISNQYRYKRNKIVEVCYVLSMTLAFESRHGFFGGNGSQIQIIIGALWCFYALSILLLNHFNKKVYIINETLFFLKLFMLPQIVLHIWSIVPIIFGKSSWGYFSTNLVTYIPCILGIFSIYLFRERAIYYTAISMIIGWLVSVIGAVIYLGPGVIVESIKEAYISDYYLKMSTSNVLEIHDIVLAVGYFLIFYFYVYKSKLTRRNLLLIFSVSVVFFLGLKRISLIGLIVIIILKRFTEKFSERKQYKLFLFSSLIMILFSYLFVFAISLIQYNNIPDLIAKIGIDPRGRFFYFNAAMSLGEFSPFYIGIGRNALGMHLINDFSYIKVTAVHSDILKVYIENGFFLLGWWVWYNAINITKRIKNRYSKNVAIYYFYLYLYTYILNLTDNIDTYFVCRILPIQLIMTYAIFGKKRFEQHGNQNHKTSEYGKSHVIRDKKTYR